MTIKALQDEIAGLAAKGREILDKATGEKRRLSAEEKAAFDAVDAEIVAAKEDLSILERAADHERALGLQQTKGARPGTTGEGKREAYGFRNLADFAVSVMRASMPNGHMNLDPRLVSMAAAMAAVGMLGGSPAAAGPMAAPSNYMQETGGSSGEGYQVPPAFSSQIFELVYSQPDILAMVNPEPTESNSVDFLKDETTPWGSSGVVANWRVEATQMTANKLVTKLGQVRLNELYAFVLASDELLADAPRLNDRLMRKAAQAISWKASDSIMWGDGVGKPTGWMNGGCLVTQAAESAQTSGTLVAANIAKMFSRLLYTPGATPVWFINPDALPQLMTMTLGQNSVWLPPSSGFQNAPGGYLLGRPVLPTEHCQTIGTVGDIQYVDPTGYYATTKAGGVQFADSIHLYFDYGLRAFRWTFRLGGQPYLSAAVAANKGSNSKSHFVALAAR